MTTKLLLDLILKLSYLIKVKHKHKQNLQFIKNMS